MAENQENIEARLCDYIEGQLDPAGRAEIEQHLAANAEHRSLIAELQAQRAMVRQLPRARAPGDIGESMEGQLEREALLGRAVDAPEETVVQIRPWPSVWAVAATLLLTAGLAAIVYYVLPGARGPAEFASSSGRTETPAT